MYVCLARPSIDRSSNLRHQLTEPLSESSASPSCSSRASHLSRRVWPSKLKGSTSDDGQSPTWGLAIDINDLAAVSRFEGFNRDRKTSRDSFSCFAIGSSST